MTKLLTVVAFAAFGAFGAVAAFSQTPPQRQNIPYSAANPAPLERDSSREVHISSLIIPPGGGTVFHHHNGDQWSMIQEGEVTFTIKGQEPRVLKVGDSVYIPRGTIHRNQNFGRQPSRSVEVLIADKGQPGTVREPN